MKTNLSTLKYLCALCCLVAISGLAAISAQTKTVWVINSGTFDVETLEKVEDTPVITTSGAFSSNDYSSAVGVITGIESRVFKFGGGIFTIPEGYEATELTIYGWPRRVTDTSITGINVDDVAIATFGEENPSPYVFANCGEEPNATSRTSDNCTIIKVLEISEGNPVKGTFKIDISGETHAFCKLVLKVSNGTGIESETVDQSESDYKDNSYYDLMGRKIENPANGVYIHKGKKVIISNK